ncbi:Golgi apparatus membrane protein tvp23 [Toensbergia leucococca]|nr:Golgi apparatus membrane protein tvp23 [Toensbergia leucococca]
MESQTQARPGDLSWRLSSHPITLLIFLAFRISSLLVYLFGVYLTLNFVLIFIITILLLAADFYYLKNIAGRRLVGLRWWNEVNTVTGDSHWVFESSEPGTRELNKTDGRFFWLAVHRIDPDGHEHAGLLSVRQVQSGNEPGLERVILWRNGEKSRGEYVQ